MVGGFGDRYPCILPPTWSLIEDKNNEFLLWIKPGAAFTKILKLKHKLNLIISVYVSPEIISKSVFTKVISREHKLGLEFMHKLKNLSLWVSFKMSLSSRIFVNAAPGFVQMWLLRSLSSQIFWHAILRKSKIPFWWRKWYIKKN